MPAAAAPLQTEAASAYVSATYNGSIRQRIESLREPVNYTSYKYVPVDTEDFPTGDYLICHHMIPMLMNSTFTIHPASADGVQLDYEKDIDNIRADHVPDTAVWHLEKKRTGYYTISQNGKNYNFTSGGYTTFNSSNNPQEFHFIRSLSSYEMSFIISAPATSNGEQMDLCSHVSNRFACFGHNKYLDDLGRYMKIYKKVQDVSINNNTVPLYNAMQEAQYYMQYDSSLAGTLNTALDCYERAFSGGVDQSTLDSLTNQLNGTINSYRTTYESQKTVAAVNLDEVFDKSDYTYHTLRRDMSKSDIQAVADRAAEFGMTGEDKVKLENVQQLLNNPDYKIDTDMEFTPKRNGDTRKIGNDDFKFSYWGTNRQVTGLWAVPTEYMTVYVKAEENDPLPTIYFTQHISNNYDKEFRLKRGINIIHVPRLYGNGWKTPTEVGGCFYIMNPYNQNQQSASVRVYIEGAADKIPLYNLGDDPEPFYDLLEDYYAHYKKGEKGYHNATEINTGNGFLTLTLERCYEAFIKEGLSVDVSAQTWSDFLDYLLAFDGVDRDSYKDLNVQCKINQPYAGAYATYEKICIQDNIWSASALSGSYGWGFPHELGHCLDNRDRTTAECTNNVWSLKYVLDNGRIDSLCVPKRLSDYYTIVKDDSDYLWEDAPTSIYNKLIYDVYMFWDLEVYHEGYWGGLDEMLRRDSCGNSTADSYLSSCSNKEKVAAYSSKVLGIDLTYYFKQYGYLLNPSQNYYNAVNSMGLSKIQPKIWYYDMYSYLRNKNSNVGKSGSISLGSYNRSTRAICINTPPELAENTVGYEIVRDGVPICFTWNNFFVDNTASANSTYTYTINAYDNALNMYSSFTFRTDSAGQAVAKVGNNYYNTLQEAVNAAPAGGTVYLTSSMLINDTVTINKSLTILPENTSNAIYVYGQTPGKSVFNITNGANVMFTVPMNTTKTALVFSTGFYQNSQSFFKVSGGSKLRFGSFVKFYSIYSTTNGAIAYLDNSSAEFINNLAEMCQSRYDGLIYLANGSSMTASGCTFRYNIASGKGSLVYASSANDTVSLNNTDIYYNAATEEKIGGTICMMAGTLNVNSGTKIRDNYSDSYNLSTAAYIANSAKANFSGNLEISDKVNTLTPVNIASDVTGQVNLRADSSIAYEGRQIAQVSGTSAFKSLTYANRLFRLSNNSGSVTLSKQSNLSVTATASARTINLGGSITVTGTVKGGTAPYKFNVYYKKQTDTTWRTAPLADGDYTALIAPKTAGTYVIRAKAKDAEDKTASATVYLTVKQPLTNNSTVSAKNATVGKALTVKMAAAGGKSPYTYAAYYKKSTASAWTLLKNYSSTATANFTPKSTGTYNIRTKVKDATGKVVNKDITIKASGGPLTNNSTISASTVTLGSSVTIKGAATGGKAPYTYSYSYKKSEASSYTLIKDFSTSTSAVFTPKSCTVYNVRVRVKDADGTVVVKVIDLTVKAAALKNTSKLSATSVPVGSAITVTGSATGGVSPYKYAFYYKKKSSSSWTSLQGFSTNKTVKITPKSVTEYIVRTKAKDLSGKTAVKDLTFTTINAALPLTNKSSLSSAGITLGSSVTVKCAATGGTSPYKYAIYYKKVSSETWTQARGYSTTASYPFTPKAATSYTIRVRVKDSTGKIVSKDFLLRVSKPLTNTSTVSAKTVTLGKSVKVTCSATGGKTPYRYAVYYRKASSDSWVQAKAYGTEQTAVINLKSAVKYVIRTKVMDADKKVAVKDITVSVTK